MADHVFSICTFTLKGRCSGNILLPTKAAKEDVIEKIHFHVCIGFAWQGFGSSGAAGMASMRSCWKLPLCPVEPMLAASKMNLPLAKAEPTSDSGRTSGITYLRRGKSCCATQQLHPERGEDVRETALQTPMSVKKEEEKVLQMPEQRFPCRPWSRPWWGRL